MFYRSARAFAPMARTGLGANQAVAGRRFTSIDTRSGKSKLIFRFGMKDVPVELYPLGFVVSLALVGGVVGESRWWRSARVATRRLRLLGPLHANLAKPPGGTVSGACGPLLLFLGTTLTQRPTRPVAIDGVGPVALA
ncbi:hypothetical protein VHUM_02609 [Vanrija humicola]|uniref:Uncharacterized protein n=1 Tax=Vanrija humicola TaxID=5417 RepID=A0A7D8UZA1_VANHU|nr:hypothetical protein VHUM_02609 [Vanrija humicola]